MAGEPEPSTLAESVGGTVAAQALPLNIKVQETDDQDELDVDREPSAHGPRQLVFISYRHGSDQPIVSALKALLERAITPSPEVFVASEGGIRPSPLGFKSQLQAAVQRAAAFIGVITQSSKDREWIFFEAGAAWGLGKLYAPFLVATNTSERGCSKRVGLRGVLAGTWRSPSRARRTRAAASRWSRAAPRAFSAGPSS